MIKYTIENKQTNQIICKKKGGRHYRQNKDSIEKGLIVVTTTKGRAERERDWLNQTYYGGWEIEKVEPIVFIHNEDTEKTIRDYEAEIEKEIEKATQKTAQEIFFRIFNKAERGDLGEFCGVGWIYSTEEAQAIAKEFGVEIEK